MNYREKANNLSNLNQVLLAPNAVTLGRFSTGVTRRGLEPDGTISLASGSTAGDPIKPKCGSWAKHYHSNELNEHSLSLELKPLLKAKRL